MKKLSDRLKWACRPLSEVSELLPVAGPKFGFQFSTVAWSFYSLTWGLKLPWHNDLPGYHVDPARAALGY